MTRHGVVRGAVAAILLLSSGPGYAACRADAACGPQPIVVPQTFFMPPIVEQQIETMSAPIAVQPPEAASEASAGGAAGPGGPLSLDELDRGIDAWLYIAPAAGFDRLPAGRLTEVAKVEPARAARPAPPKIVQEIAPHLMIELPVTIRSAAVPGIEASASESGNRSLWFPQDGR